MTETPPTDSPASTPTTARPCVTVDRIASIDAPPQRVFEHAASMAPDALIRPRGPMPGVASWTGCPVWRAPGDQRILVMTEGVVLTEELIAITPPHRFTYRTTGFSSWFGHLNASCITSWTFAAETAGGGSAGKAERVPAPMSGPAQVTWRVNFFATGRLAAIILPYVVKPLWPGFMGAALERLADACERGT